MLFVKENNCKGNINHSERLNINASFSDFVIFVRMCLLFDTNTQAGQIDPYQPGYILV